jgi:hypothetical protein
MQCEIYPIRYEKSFRWKWRHVAADGSVKESQDVYALYYECVVAARKCGYAPALRGRQAIGR